MDFEEELESHFIRKEPLTENSNEKGVRSGKTNKPAGSTIYKETSRVHDYIPSILKHLLSLRESSWQENSIISIQNGRIRFKNCLVYGDVLYKVKEKNARHIYILDDGTGCLEISIFRKDKNVSTVSRLQRNLSDIVEFSEKKIVDSLRNILTATRNQVYNYNINPGTKVLLYGRPYIYCNKVSLDVYHILQDNTSDRSMEIAFKDELVDWYTKYIRLANGLNS